MLGFLSKNIKITGYLLYIIIIFYILFYGYSNTEEYESVFAYLFSQANFKISYDFSFLDTNNFTLPIILWVNSFFKGIQIYSYYLFFLTAISGLLWLHLILELKNIDSIKKVALVLCFLTLQISNFLFVSSVRISVLLTILLLFHYNNQSLSKVKYILLFTLCIIVRIDTVVLLTACYIVVHVIANKKITFHAFKPFIVSFLSLMLYNITIEHYSSDLYKILYYYEIELIDKSNIDYKNLNDINKYIFGLLKTHIIFDEKIFDLEFVQKSLKTNYSHFTNNIANPTLFVNLLKNSFNNLLISKEIIILSFFFLTIGLIFNGILNRKLMLTMFLLPILICLYTTIPLRFFYPYYMMFIVFSIASLPSNKKGIQFLLIPIFIFSIIHISNNYKFYSLKRYEFYKTQRKISIVKEKNRGILVFENFYARNWEFANPDIKYKYKNNNTHFLNMGFFQCFEFYETDWKKLGNISNPNSIKEKIQLMESENIPLIIDNKSYIITYSTYLNKRYSFFSVLKYIDWSEIQ